MACKKIKILIFLLLAAIPTLVFANPEGEVVVSGTADFDRTTTPDTLVVTTPSDKLIVNYNSFSIAEHETTKFVQPSANSIALNRVVGVDPSQIMGTLTANGRVFIINPNGVIFGPNSHVDCAGLVASTMDIENSDFLNGNYNFYKKDGSRNSYVINQSRDFIIKNGGYVCLLSQAVDNQGVIIADLGRVVLASGTKMTLALDDLNDISVTIDEGVSEAVFGPDGKKIDSAVKNSGEIYANGGKVILTAKVLNHAFDYAINNTGIIEAKSLVNHNGTVELVADGAPILNIGKIEAGQINIKALNTDFINKGQVISPKIEGLPASGLIYIKTINLTQDGLIAAIGGTVTVEAETIKTSLAVAPVTDPASLALLVIRANQVNILSRSVGSTGFPIAIDAPNIYFNRTAGNIDILESIGIGSSILLRGPPDGFGEIIYNRDANLELDAAKVTLVGSNPTYLYGNIIFHNFECITPDKEIYFEAGHTYTFKGTFNVQGAPDEGAEEFLIKLRSSQAGSYWYLDLQSTNYTFDLANVQDAYALGHIFIPVGVNAGHNVNIEIDPVWDGTGSGNNWSTANNWVGNVLPSGADEVRFNSTSTKDCTIDNVGSWSGGRFVIEAGYTGTITQKVNITVGNFEQAGGTFKTYYTTYIFWVIPIQHPQTLTIGGSFIKTGGTFDNSNGSIVFNSPNLNNTITSSGTAFKDLTFTGGGAWELQDDLTVTGSGLTGGKLAIDNGNLIANGNDISVSGGLLPSFTIGTNGKLTLQGNETITVPLLFSLGVGNDGTVVYTGNGVTPGVYNVNDWIYNNLTIDSSIGTADVFSPTNNLTINGNLDVAAGTLDVGAVNITVAGTTFVSGTLTHSSATGTKRYTGLVSILGGGIWNNSGNANINFRGGLTNNGTFTAGNGVYTFNTNSQAIGGTNEIIIPKVTITGVTLTNNGTLTVTNSLIGSGGLTNKGILNINCPTFTLATLNASTNGNTVNYGYNGAQTIKAITYYNLETSTGGTKIFGGDIGATNIKVGAGTIINPATHKITIAGGTVDIYGTLLVDGVNFSDNYTGTTSAVTYRPGSTVDYCRLGDQFINSHDVYSNLVTSGSGIKTLDGSSTVTISGDLTIGSGTTFDVSANNCGIVLVGNWINNGTFNARNGTTTFNGNTTVGGSSTTTFNNVIINLGHTLVGAPGNMNVAGNWTNNGTFTHNNGTVTFTGGSGVTQELTPGGSHFYNIIHSGAGTLNLLVDDLYLEHNFTNSNGNFNLGDHELYVEDDLTISGGTLTQGSKEVNAINFYLSGDGIFNQGSGLVDINYFIQSGGTFNGGIGDIYVDHDFMLSGGTFTSTSGTLSVVDNWTHTAGGIFNHNNGTVVFGGGNGNIDVATSEIFKHLTFDSTGTKTISSGDTLITTGTLTLANGIVNTGTLEAQGNVVVGPGFDGGDSPLKFTGNAAQTFDLTGAEALFNGNITVDKITGTEVTLLSDLTMDQASQTLTVDSGIFNPGMHLVTGVPTGSLIVNDTIKVNAATFAGNYTGFGTITLNPGSIVHYAGINQFIDSTLNYINLEISGGGTKTLDGDISISGDLTVANGTDLDGAHNLHVDGDAVIDGTIGAGIPLTSFYVGGTTGINGSSITTTGTQIYNGVVTLCAVATNLTGSTITFNSALNSDPTDLTITGDAVFNAPVGGGGSLNSLHVTGTTAINGGLVTTLLTQLYHGVVTLGADTTLTGSTITFDSTVNSATFTARDLGITGNVVFGGIVGGTNPLDTLSVSGTTNINTTAITTTGTQTYTGAVTLGANTTLTGTDVNFMSTLDSDATARALIVNASGTTLFNGVVGGINPIDSITTDAPGTTDIQADITTVGSQTYNDPVYLSNNVILASNAAGDIKFMSTLDSDATARALTVNTAGITLFNGIVGGTNPLLSLTTDAAGTTRINGGAVTTTSDQTYNDQVTLGADTTLTANNGVTLALVRFMSTLNSSGSARTLLIDGNARFDGTVGNASPYLASLEVNGTSAINGGSVRTTGNQTYHGAVTLGANAVLRAGNNIVNFGSTITGGAHSLTIGTNTGTNTNVIFGGAVSGLTTLEVFGTSAINGGSISSTGNQTYHGAVTLGADTTLTANNGVTLALVRFMSTLRSDAAGTPRTLLIDGNAQFDGVVGGSSRPLASLTVNGATNINTTAITTTGNQIYTGPVTLNQGVTLIAGADTITFGNTITGGTHSLTIGSGTNATNATFGNTVSGLTTLEVFGNTSINTTGITSTGNQTYHGAVTLGANAVLRAGNNTVNFMDTITGANHSLTIGATGSSNATKAIFGNTVSGLTTLDVYGTSAINGGSINSSSTQRYRGAVTLGANTTLTGSTVTFDSTVNADLAANNRDLTIAGNAVFNGIVGGIQALHNLAVTGAANTTTINTTAITTSGTQNYAGPVTVGVDSVLKASSIAFGSTVTGAARILTLNTTSGGVTQAGAFTLNKLLLLGTGTYTLNQNNDIDILAANVTGAITFKDIDDLIVGTVNGVNGITTGGNDLIINAGNNLTLAQLINAGAGDVTLTSTLGSIIDGNGDVASDNIIAKHLVLSAATGIGSLNALETAVSYINAYNSTSGNIEIDNTGNLTIDDFSLGTGWGIKNVGGDVDIKAHSSIDIPGTNGDGVWAEGDITLTADDDITAGFDNDLTSVESNSGSVLLNAGRDIYLGENGYADIYTSNGPGDITLIAGNDITIDNDTCIEADTGKIDITAGNDVNLISTGHVSTGAGDIDIKATAGNVVIGALAGGVISTSGDISLTAGNDVEIGYVATAGDVTITATAGEIKDNNAGATNVAANLLTATAATGINLDTNINTLDASVTGIGNITIDETDAITLADVDTANGSITINAGGTITATDVQSLTDADANDIKLTTTAGDIEVGIINAGSTAGDVDLTAAGSITDNDGDSLITADQLSFIAGLNVGTSLKRINTKVNEILAGTATTGNIYLEEQDGATFTNLFAGGLIDLLAHATSIAGHIEADGSVTIRLTNGDLTILTGTVQSNSSWVKILLDTGSLYATGDGPHVVANDDSYISTPNGTITAIGQALYVIINGHLILNIGAKVSGVSGRLNGLISDGGFRIPLFVPSSYPFHLYPPGKVFYNGRMIWPSIFTYLLSQSYQALNNNPNLPDSEQFKIYQYNTADTRLALFYHPLTEYDMAAFDQFNLGDDAYEFINGQVNILGHDGLLPILEEVRKRKKNTI